MKEAAELREPTEHYHAQPLEDNLFEWHFSVRGPPDSDFDGGVYHGRIVLPPEYPMKPPSIILLTPNGRFEVGKKICLSISGHHPETWQPSWSIRTALIAIIGFMPTKGEGAIGSLDYTPEERRALAKKSQDFCCDACGCTMRTALLSLTANSNASLGDQQATELARQINFKAESSTSSKPSASQAAASETPEASASEAWEVSAAAASTEQVRDKRSPLQPSQGQTADAHQSGEAAAGSRPLSPRQRRAAQHQSQQPQPARRPAFPFPAATRPPQEAGHAGSAVLIVVLTLALAALIFRRVYLANEYKFDYEL
ncbi:ubiquitin-conjugating enzyme E2 J1 isoform X3 [Paramormyrops kingsleyae]